MHWCRAHCIHDCLRPLPMPRRKPPLPLSQARRVRTRMSLIAASQSTKPLLPMPFEASPFPCSL